MRACVRTCVCPSVRPFVLSSGIGADDDDPTTEKDAFNVVCVPGVGLPRRR